MLTLASVVPAQSSDAPAEPEALRVAQAVWPNDQQPQCFSEAFLGQVDRRTSLNVHDRLDVVELDSPKLFRYPLVVLWGRGKFELSEKQMKNVSRYLRRGGMLLATTMCADPEWDTSFRAAMKALLPKSPLEDVPTDHAVFRTLYRIERVRTVKPAEHPLLGAEQDGRLAVIYSPIDLRDAYNLGTACCCCGANEVRNAMAINANILVYAATR